MRALVVGGGIAGPAAALALQRLGVDAVVLEGRATADPEAGSYLTVAPNGLDALAALGALDLARAVRFPSRRNVIVGSSGSRLGELSLGRPLADGTVALTLKRSALAVALAQEATRRGVEVRHGARVAAVTDSGTEVEAVLADGTRLRGDLLVDADGVHSLVRRAIDPAAPAARYVGLANFGGITRASALAADLRAQAWHFVFGRHAFFGAHPTPAGDVVWFVNVPRPRVGREERATTSPEQWQRQLVALLESDAGPAAELVRTGVLELAGDSTHDLGHVPHWHRGRTVLLGDAAHAPSPSSGQGASLALEDAVLLAVALREHPGDPTGAFTAFERVRRPRVEKVVRAGARSSSAKIPGPAGRAVRDVVLRLVFRYAVTERSTAWTTDHRVDLDAPLPARG